jgi:hypothetical protein
MTWGKSGLLAVPGTVPVYYAVLSIQCTGTIPNTDYDRSKTTGECGIFQLLRYLNNK